MAGFLGHGGLGLDTIPEDDTDVRSQSASRSGLGASWFRLDSRSVTGDSVAETTKAVILTQGPSSDPPIPPRIPDPAPTQCSVNISWKMWLLIGILAVAVGGGIFGIVSAVRAETTSALGSPTTVPSVSPVMITSNDDNFLPTDSPSRSPSIQPSVPLEELQFFLAANVSSEVLDPSTAHYQTWYWLAYEDPAQIRLGDDDDDDWKIIQRFLVAYLYFSLDGANWTSDNFLTGDIECNWDGIECNDTLSVIGIKLCDAKLSGSLPSELSQLSGIKWLVFANNSLTGTIPETWWNFQNLQLLNLSANAITGQLSSRLWNITSLLSLDVVDNLLTGGIPEVSDDARPLTILLADENELSGTLPASLWNLTNLAQLSLTYNKLTGGLPVVPEGRSIVLEALFLDHNQMQGSLPPCIGMDALGSFVTRVSL